MDSKNKKIITFSANSIELIDDVKDVNDSQFCKARLTCFGSGVTAHGYSFTDEVIKEAEFSILGKAILFKYNILTDDCDEHNSDEVPAGFIPLENANITYSETENGLMMTVDCYIWKLYSGKLCEILERTDGIKDVSVELWILESIEHEDTKVTEVLKFVYTACTILGERINPAKKGSKIEVIKFSEQENNFIKAKEQFEKQLYNSLNVNQEPSTQIENDGSFLYCNKENANKEDNMAKEILENSVDNAEVVNNSTTDVVENSCDKTLNSDSDNPEVIENAEKITYVRVTEDTTTTLYDDNNNFVGEVNEYNTKSTTKVEDVSNEEVNATAEVILNSEDSTDYKVKFSEMELKCSQLETENSTLKTNIYTLELKCSELQNYKDNKENELKVHAIECAINDVVDVLSVEQITEWRNKSVNCSDVSKFMNELKAFAFDIQKNSGIKPQDQLRNSISTPLQSVSENVWDRLDQKY